jgi:integrator complex subunit 1
MWWFQEVVSRTYKPSAQLYSKCVYKVLFLASHEEYFNVDGWPAESDRAFYYKATSEVPLLQDTMIRTFMIGLSRTITFTARDTVSLAEMLAKRAAALHNFDSSSSSTTDFPSLMCDKPAEMFDLLFKLTAYSFPDTIALPKDYVPPSMAIGSAYWTVRHSFRFSHVQIVT